jgi:MinD-like ATPase involved in chromosome partitioning or flagellar assembly
MYTVTFYSFKGGVGRSMALVNVAAELVLSGSRVLIVDFDLEAPGLDTFNLGGPGPDALGVVDYVDSYRRTGIAPDIRDYVHNASIGGRERDRFWVMPAGKQDSDYGFRLAGVDWQKLYSDSDGYLLFEDLKAQWQKTIRPDYVLIDSRTGHTDVGGICTRQLPDAVAMFFFPNEQNRVGLEKVVRQIRQEANPPRGKQVTLHFVMSNVPDLDDEEQILAGSVKRLRRSLEYEDLAATIHHYPSLALLNQTVFTLHRPRSRLAQEYRQLAKVIKQNNLEDRDGSLEFLKQVQRGPARIPRPIPLSDIESRITEILKKHSTDGEILRQVAGLRRLQRRYADAVSLLSDASKAGSADADLLLSRAEMNYSLGEKSAAISDLKRLLTLSDVPIWQLVGAVKLLADLDSQEAGAVTTSPAVEALDSEDQASLAVELMTSSNTRSIAGDLIGSLMSREPSELRVPDSSRNQIALSLIAQRRFSDAKRILTPRGSPQEPLPLAETFNYAIAIWGETGNPVRDLFQRVLDRQHERPEADPNFLQCLALAYWVVGEKDQALEQLAGARRLMTTQGGETFSAWRYLAVSPAQFSEDLDSMERMIKGEGIKPLVLREGTTQ